MPSNLADNDPRHGALAGYRQGCRCRACRDAWNAWSREARYRRQAKITPDDPRHGTASFYRNHACHCDRCLAAQRWLRQLTKDSA